MCENLFSLLQLYVSAFDLGAIEHPSVSKVELTIENTFTIIVFAQNSPAV